MTTPLLARTMRGGEGGQAAAAAGVAAGAADQAVRSSTAGFETPLSVASAAGMSQPSQGRRTPSLMEFPVDHFSFGDIAGLGRSVYDGGVLHQDYFNRGKGFHEEQRERLNLPALVESGRHAGRSRVVYQGAGIGLHLLKRDFFITMLQTPVMSLLALFALAYLGTFFFWGTVYYLLVRFYPGCLYGASGYVESWTFAIATQMTIGYGNTGPQNCLVAGGLITMQSITDLLLNAVILGLIFAKVASPKHRAFSIYISDSACIARRDGILKFMFRVADVRRTQVIEPRVKAYLYTWGEGRVTAEGERIQVRCEQLYIDYIDGMLLLPLIIEHTIDERSPLCGHNYDSLAAMNAEIVVTFEATTELGNPFFARQSYLAQEINWSCHFAEIIGQPAMDTEQPRYSVDLDHFHDVTCPDAESPSVASQLVVNRAKRAVPYPLLGENTLVMSDVLCVRPSASNSNAMELVCRVADTYPSQMLEVVARIYLYRWHPPEWCSAHPDRPSFTLRQLPCGYKTGTDRLYLHLPQEVVHTIDGSSPLAGWLEPGGLSQDADSEIVVLLQAYLHVSAQNRMRQRTYRVNGHVRYGFTFAPAVRPPAECRDGKPRVRWAHFFDVEPVSWGQPGGGRPTLHLHSSALNHPALMAYLQHGSTSAAPESHAPVRAQLERSQVLAEALDRPQAESPRARWVAAARAAERASAAAAAVASAGAAGGGAAAAAERPGKELPASVAEPGLRQAADLMGRDSTATPQAPMDPYASTPASPSVLPHPQGLEAFQGSSSVRGSAISSGLSVLDPWQHLERRRRPGPHISGPPDLTTLSAGPSVPLDRYAAGLTHPSMEQPAGGAWSAEQRDAVADEQHYLQQQQHEQHHYQQQQQYQTDLLPSDLTATPGVPLARYAAMVGAEPSGEFELSGRADGGGSAAAATVARLPRRPPGGSLYSGLPAGPWPGRRRSNSAEEAEGKGEDAIVGVQRVGSWQRRRSLANLQAIFEAESQPASDSE